MGNPSIVRWLKKMCKKHGLSAFYMPDRDVYMIHLKGRVVQGFTGPVFYQITKDAREKQFAPLIKLGLRLNIDEKTRDQLFTRRKLGRTIVA